jgi:hypothetical protein
MDPACTTVNGACTATWTSQNPRPAASALSKVGHAYVLAYVVGEESFRDNNGDGVFDAADGFPTADNKGEIFADSNENGSYDVGETFFDFDKSNNYTAADGKWYGINCQDPTRCGTRSLTGVGDAFCIVMSTSAANIAGPGGAVSVGTGVNLTYTIADTNGNAMAGGTTVTLIQTGVTNANVSSPGLPFTFPDIGCGGSGVSFTITVTPGSTPPPSGTLQLVVTSKSGLITSGPVVTLGP